MDSHRYVRRYRPPGGGHDRYCASAKLPARPGGVGGGKARGPHRNTAGLQPGWVDSSFVDVQPLGLGFSLVDLRTETVDAGVRVTGAIINGGSLNHYDAAFTVSLGENRQTKVVIPELAAGHSAPFEAIVGPAADKSVPEKVRILFAGSTVSYY